MSSNNSPSTLPSVLRRPVLNASIAATSKAVIGGAEVSLGGLAAMTVVGAVLKSVPGSDFRLAQAHQHS